MEHVTKLARLAVATILASSALLTGCLPTPIPMTYVKADVPPTPAPARCLVVLLPGIGDNANDFQKKGMVDTIRAAGLSADVFATNATFGYYMRGMMPQRFWDDVVHPLQLAGHYDSTWLVGVSMGGLGSLLSAQHHASEITGVIALAPYLGRDKTVDAVKKGGGLEAWNPPPADIADSDNFDIQLWRWLKFAAKGQVEAPELLLGFGDDDKLRDADKLLAAALPKEHVLTMPGTHDWPTWNQLLARILRDSPKVDATCRARKDPQN